MMLHALAPFVEILVALGDEGLLERLARRAVAKSETLGERAEIVGIDGEPGKSRPDLEQSAHGIRRRAPLEILLCGMAPLLEP